ncbi:MAG: glycine-rich domain-containing protein-like [Bryobacterales bacterium]|nr:glycine-rich domain-containing protein-like [Bryobacterales bacterium]
MTNDDQSLLLFQNKVAALDLDPIIFKLMNPEDGEGCTLHYADTLAIQYRQFLTLCYLYPEENIVPTQPIDKIWHTHILDTKKYQDDCEFLFGYYLHHFPYFGLRGDDDKNNLAKAGKETRRLFNLHFPYALSTQTADCTTQCGSSQCKTHNAAIVVVIPASTTSAHDRIVLPC